METDSWKKFEYLVTLSLLDDSRTPKSSGSMWQFHNLPILVERVTITKSAINDQWLFYNFWAPRETYAYIFWRMFAKHYISESPKINREIVRSPLVKSAISAPSWKKECNSESAL